MECNRQHEQHNHQHGSDCGHTAIRHGEQTGYLHEGHLHVSHGDHFDDAAMEVNSRNPERCTPQHDCGDHASEHKHNAHCGHEQVPHGNHVDYLVGDHLHHEHDDHCDDHGRVEILHRASRAA